METTCSALSSDVEVNADSVRTAAFLLDASVAEVSMSPSAVTVSLSTVGGGGGGGNDARAAATAAASIADPVQQATFDQNIHWILAANRPTHTAAR